MDIRHDIQIEPDYRVGPRKTTILWRKVIFRPRQFENCSPTERLGATLLTIQVKLEREDTMHNDERRTYLGGEYTNEL